MNTALQSPQPRIWTNFFALTWVGSLLMFATMQMLTPTLPMVAKNLGGGDSAGGILQAVFTLGALLPRTLFGRLADRYGRRPVVLWGMLIFLAGLALMFFTNDLTGILVARLIQGIGISAASTAAGTMASDLIPAERRAEGLGYFAMASTVGMAVGPGIGLALVAGPGASALYWGALGLSMVGLVALWFTNYEKKNPVASAKPSVSATGHWIDHVFERTVWAPCLVLLFVSFAYGGVITYLAALGFHRGITDIGLFFTVMAVSLFGIRFVVGKISDRVGYSWVLVPGIVLILGAMAWVVVAQSLVEFLVIAFLFGIGYGAVQPILQAIVIALSPPERRGVANASLYATMDIGLGLGGLVLGLAIGSLGIDHVFILSAGSVLVGLILYLIVLSPRLPARH